MSMAHNVFRAAYSSSVKRIVIASPNHAADWYQQALAHERRWWRTETKDVLGSCQCTSRPRLRPEERLQGHGPQKTFGGSCRNNHVSAAIGVLNYSDMLLRTNPSLRTLAPLSHLPEFRDILFFLRHYFDNGGLPFFVSDNGFLNSRSYLVGSVYSLRMSA